MIKQSSYFGHLQTSRNNIVAFSIAVFLKVFTFLSMTEYFVFISVFQCFLTGVSFNLVRKRFKIWFYSFSSKDSRKVQHSDYYRLPAQPLENIFITVFVIETIILPWKPINSWISCSVSLIKLDVNIYLLCNSGICRTITVCFILRRTNTHTDFEFKRVRQAIYTNQYTPNKIRTC